MSESWSFKGSCGQLSNTSIILSSSKSTGVVVEVDVDVDDEVDVDVDVDDEVDVDVDVDDEVDVDVEVEVVVVSQSLHVLSHLPPAKLHKPSSDNI